MDKANKPLIIQTNKYNGESKVISVRIPDDMLSDIDNVVSLTGKSRNEVIMICLEYALKNMQVE